MQARRFHIKYGLHKERVSRLPSNFVHSRKSIYTEQPSVSKNHVHQPARHTPAIRALRTSAVGVPRLHPGAVASKPARTDDGRFANLTVQGRPRTGSAGWFHSDLAGSRSVRIHVCAKRSRALKPDRRDTEFPARCAERRGKYFCPEPPARCTRSHQLCQCDELRAGAPAHAAAFHPAHPGNPRTTDGGCTRRRASARRVTAFPELDRACRLHA